MARPKKLTESQLETAQQTYLSGTYTLQELAVQLGVASDTLRRAGLTHVVGRVTWARLCKRCGTLFTEHSRTRQYCPDHTGTSRQGKRATTVTVMCSYCGMDLDRKASRLGARSFCHQWCRSKWMHLRRYDKYSAVALLERKQRQERGELPR